MKKRTNVDYSKHEVFVTESEGLLIHHLKKPGTGIEAVKFINTQGILAVTGDFGNWIFCREFHPSPEGGVSDGYWCEKLQISSSQEPEEFDAEATKKEIIERLKDRNSGYDKADRQYLKDCYRQLERDDSEFWYSHFAYENLPSGHDHEFVPLVKRHKFWLKAVFDAFDEICSRMKSEMPVAAAASS